VLDPVDALPWPAPDAWLAALGGSDLVAIRAATDLDEPDDAGTDVAPLTLAGDRLYLDRYWRYERRVARSLDTRARRPIAGVDLARLRAGLDAALRGDAPDRQRVAAALAVTRHLAVVAGGPGTGKTTTVAAILRLLDDQAAATGRRPPVVALAAPTGKAAARLTESLRDAAARDVAALDVAARHGAARHGAARDDDPTGDGRLTVATATTLHRLLGSRGGARFRHGRHDPLPHDVVVVDETSMVDVAMLARLLDAVREDARIVLLGDPHQLASVEAGSVLADVVGDPAAPPTRSDAARSALVDAAGHDAGVHDALVVLDRVHRFAAGSGLDRFAAAVRAGDADEALEQLTTATDLTWIGPTETGAAPGRHVPSDDPLAAVHARVVEVGGALHAAGVRGDGAAALDALDDLRVLCAHRRGGSGAAGWNARAEAWLGAAIGTDVRARWYVGRPVLVTANDHRLQLWNGDLGVVVRDLTTGGVTVAFPAPAGTGVRHLAPARLGEVETVHAMTVHKSQGSQVGHAVVVLPEPVSRICTRELLYTAITRARAGATVVTSEATLRATIAARTQRASGLGIALGR
jgi:exodeoxyribonuclease V alpha subunit